MEAYKLNESTQRGLSSANNDEYEMEDDTSEEGSVITTSTRSNVSRKSTRLNLRSQKVSVILPSLSMFLTKKKNFVF